ncbi:MAG: ATP-dependent Clp protease ATP-binding subunit, partial [Actinomycetota bacterium]|nr:ATP-dependent Clp protease ATP-binding subunit [Actinomycetota bacterium]
SWSEIGRRMGVTKQAAQKRFVSKGSDADLDPNQGFSRFTEQARNVVMAAQNEARAAGNPKITPEHLALGLLSEPDSLAARAIVAQGGSLGTLRRTVSTRLAPAGDQVPDLIPYDAQARKALELSFREALRLGHNWVGTEHILLALLELEEGLGVLAGLGEDEDATDETVQASVAAEITARDQQRP